MATFVKCKGPDGRLVWQARVRKRGYPQRTRTFSLKANADAWALRVEREMESDNKAGAQGLRRRVRSCWEGPRSPDAA